MHKQKISGGPQLLLRVLKCPETKSLKTDALIIELQQSPSKQGTYKTAEKVWKVVIVYNLQVAT